jgi:hypothetical protein
VTLAGRLVGKLGRRSLDLMPTDAWGVRTHLARGVMSLSELRFVVIFLFLISYY